METSVRNNHHYYAIHHLSPNHLSITGCHPPPKICSNGSFVNGDTASPISSRRRLVVNFPGSIYPEQNVPFLRPAAQHTRDVNHFPPAPARMVALNTTRASCYQKRIFEQWTLRRRRPVKTRRNSWSGSFCTKSACALTPVWWPTQDFLMSSHVRGWTTAFVRASSALVWTEEFGLAELNILLNH